MNRISLGDESNIRKTGLSVKKNPPPDTEKHHGKDKFRHLKEFSNLIDLMQYGSDIDEAETIAFSEDRNVLRGNHHIRKTDNRDAPSTSCRSMGRGDHTTELTSRS
jgi:hypothetical protein